MSGITTAERVRQLLHYEPDTGALMRLISSGRARAGDVVRGVCNGYLTPSIDGRRYPAHRLIWLWMTGVWPTANMDHINGDRLDNRWCNLREASATQNNANRPMHTNNRSGFKGVIWRKVPRKWEAKIRINGKARFLGRYDTPERAFIEYCFAGWRHFGDFFLPDADYIRMVKKHKERKALEHSVLWNLANPDPNYMIAE